MYSLNICQLHISSGLIQLCQQSSMGISCVQLIRIFLQDSCRNDSRTFLFFRGNLVGFPLRSHSFRLVSYGTVLSLAVEDWLSRHTSCLSWCAVQFSSTADAAGVFWFPLFWEHFPAEFDHLPKMRLEREPISSQHPRYVTIGT